MARLNWRLIHMASEGLFPQLIVIPLHRDHGVITMAAGKNDVIKLLPPLTLSESEARSFLDALDAVLAECHGSASKNLAVVRDIATTTLRRRARAKLLVSEPTPFAASPSIERVRQLCLVTGATGFIGGHLAGDCSQEGTRCAASCERSSDTSLLEQLDVEIAVGDLTDAGSLARAVEGCHYVFHCGALVSDWATTEEIAAINVDGTRNLLDAAVAASVRRFVHFSTTDVYGYPGDRRSTRRTSPTRFRNWYAQTKLEAEAEVRRVERARARSRP